MIDDEGVDERMRRKRRALGVAVAMMIALAIHVSSAAATKYVDSFFGNPFTTTPTTTTSGPGGLFNTPGGIAASDTSGAVYVVDRGNHRIQQFDTSNSFVRAWGAGVTTGGATGTGTVTNGLTSVTSVVTTAKAFSPGQRITGTGIAPGTTIAAVAAGGTITLSQAATPAATGAGTALSVATGAGNVAQNEKQTVTLGANTTGGTFTLTYSTPNPSNSTATTAGIPWDASPAAVQTALENLSNLDPGDVAVTSSNPGGGVIGGPYTFEFTGSRYGDMDVNQMTSSATGLTVSSGTKSATVATTVIGAAAAEACTVAADCKAGLALSVATAVGGAFNTPQGVAVDQSSGSVYVTDGSNFRVQQFTAAGQFIRAWGRDVINTGSPNDTGTTALEVCDTTAGNSASDCKGGVAGAVGGAFGSSFTGYPAVAPAGAPNEGNVLVADPGQARVQEFTSVGGFVRAFGFDVVQTGGTGDDTDTDGAGPDLANQLEICTSPAQCQAGAGGAAVGQLSGPSRVAVDNVGSIYTVEPTANFRVQKFAPGVGDLGASVFAPAHLGQEGGAIAASTSSSPTDVVFDRETGRVLVSRGYVAAAASHQPAFSACATPTNERRILEFNPAGALRDTHMACAGVNSNGVSTSGLAIRASNGVLYNSTTQTGGVNRHRVYKLDSDGVTPAIATVNPASAVTASSASLSGSVDPNSVDNDLAPTGWKLQVSRNGADWTTVANGTVGTGVHPDPNAPYAVSGTASGLLPNTLYRVRVVTFKPLGNPEVGSPELTFSTDALAPEIRTTAVQTVSDTAATISARINPHSTSTAYRFEWGKTTFDRIIPIPDRPIGSGPDYVLVSEDLTGLAPNTTYKFRAIAVSSTAGVTVGPTSTFTTGSPPSSTPVPGSPTPEADHSYELVSPARKIGGQGVGDWYTGVESHGYAGDAAYNGDRFASQALLGGVLVDGGYSYGNDWSLAERQPSGWGNEPAFNRAGGQGEPEVYRTPTMTAASDDLSLMAWSSNNKGLRIFPEQETVFGTFPIADGDALREWHSGKWEIIGPLAPEQNSTDAAEGAVTASIVASDGGYGLTLGQLRGLEGAGDPTAAGRPDLVCAQGPPVNKCNRSIYIDDVTAGLSDTFPGAGIRSLVNKCTGSGSDRTILPSVTASDEIGADFCIEQTGPGAPTAQLISPFGGYLETDRRNAVSADGSRVFFVSPDVPNTAACSGTGPEDTVCPPQLYVRDRAADGTITTRWISRSRSEAADDGAFDGALIPGQEASLMSGVVFEGATRDGDKVYFRTASPLTPDDPNGDIQIAGGVTDGSADAKSVDLYMYDFPDALGADPGDGTLTRISAGPTGDGDGNVSTGSTTPGGPIPAGGGGALRGMSEMSGERVYFVTAGTLPDVPSPGNGTVTSPGGTPITTTTKNLYLYDGSLASGERWRFIANLPALTPLGGCATTGANVSGETLAPKPGGGVQRPNGINCVKATSDGAFIVFVTDGRLTADDPDATSGDVYAYDADRDELIRISAATDGIGGSYVCINGSTAGSGDPSVGTRCNGDTGISDAGRRTLLSVATDPTVAGDRAVFFESASRLVAADHNDVYDVYRWRNGELSLVSSGAEDAEDALYRGNDRTGRNVYVSTRERLSWEDQDAVLDVYSVREGGGIPQPIPPNVCGVLADGCQPPGAGVPTTPTQPRTALPGVGNVPGVKRLSLRVRAPSAAARRAAARKGILAIRVGADGVGEVTAMARAKVKRAKRLAAVRGSAHIGTTGGATLELRLSAAIKRLLKTGREVRLIVSLAMPGARNRAITVVLKRPGR